MSWTQDDLDAIDRAIKSGSTRVRLDGREREYRTLDDLLRIRAIIAGELGILDGARIRVQYPGSSKGLT